MQLYMWHTGASLAVAKLTHQIAHHMLKHLCIAAKHRSTPAKQASGGHALSKCFWFSVSQVSPHDMLHCLAHSVFTVLVSFWIWDIFSLTPQKAGSSCYNMCN